MINVIGEIIFFLQRLNWLSAIDILIVTLIFLVVILLLRETQGLVILRGVLLLVLILGVFTNLEFLPAFSWLVRITLPALVVVVPVIFAPEIRRALERLGRASVLMQSSGTQDEKLQVVEMIVRSAEELAENRHGALMVLQRLDPLQEYIETGVQLGAYLSDKLLTQIFHPNTPLHDGAVIISGSRLLAAACVMPLATGSLQEFSARRQVGLRHRAAIGISAASDAVAVVISEETGVISIAYGGRLIRRVDTARLRNILSALYHPTEDVRGPIAWLNRIFRPNKDRTL